MRYFLRRIIIAILYGWYILTGRSARTLSVAVLMYHSVSDTDWFFAVSSKEFDRQMRYLKEHYTPIKLSDVADFLEGKRSIPERAVVVTFDDGYQDFMTNALPVLKKYKIPSTIFVCAGSVDRKELGTYFPLLEWEGVRGAGESSLVDIGSHALTHKKLTKLSPEEAENEIASSKVIIEKEARIRPHFFAYPKGSFNNTLGEAVFRAGYRGAVSAIQQLVTIKTSRYAIPRIQVDRSTSFLEFKARLTPVTDWYYWIWKIKIRLKHLFSS